MRQILPPRSAPWRERALDRLTRRRWDLLVVGGGITGSAVARDAALRGLRVALVEQADIAYGTSSRSSRLIHGGLRYLANLDFGLVREGLVERRRLLDQAPGLVRSVPFLYPVYAGDPDPLWKVNLGVTLYELLSLGYGLGGKRRLDAAAVRAMIPSLEADGLKGGVLYRDAATHDTRLTLAVALSGAAAGALLATRCRARELVRRRGRVAGVVLDDLLGDRPLDVRARAVVLCCGPWQRLYETTPVRLRTARGTHLSVAAERLPIPSFVALRSPRDGRLAFAMPVEEHTVLGTTDAYDPGEPGDVRPSREEVGYLLELAHHAFPGCGLSAADVVGAWAGLRPLVEEDPHGDADDLSREHRIARGEPGLWVLTGGKLTTHREMAEECLDQVVPTLGGADPKAERSATRDRPLVPGSLEAGRRRLAELGAPAARIEVLTAHYGNGVERLAHDLERHLAGRAYNERALERVQIELAVGEELALSLGDLLMRRIGPGALDLEACRQSAPKAARTMGRLLGWNRIARQEQVAAFLEGIERDLEAARAPATAVPPGG